MNLGKPVSLQFSLVIFLLLILTDISHHSKC